jgi:hypothetical protein
MDEWRVIADLPEFRGFSRTWFLHTIVSRFCFTTHLIYGPRPHPPPFPPSPPAAPSHLPQLKVLRGSTPLKRVEILP